MHTVVVTAANVADVTQTAHYLHGEETEATAAAAYTGVENVMSAASTFTSFPRRATDAAVWVTLATFAAVNGRLHLLSRLINVRFRPLVLWCISGSHSGPRSWSRSQKRFALVVRSFSAWANNGS